uniref:Uncharacterized protein n=1 Tax=Podoviridae sp. ctuch15 TaxID=2827752 RepID=A0A8S5T3D6_9CAUD|nr:MAG TPA: hypothetical protein [Podoviridae sp. ctuch15]
MFYLIKDNKVQSMCMNKEPLIGLDGEILEGDALDPSTVAIKDGKVIQKIDIPETEPEEEVKLDAVTVLEAIVDIQEEVMNNSLALESLKNKEE